MKGMYHASQTIKMRQKITRLPFGKVFQSINGNIPFGQRPFRAFELGQKTVSFPERIRNDVTIRFDQIVHSFRFELRRLLLFTKLR